jgi:hypothetical protein
MGVVLFQAQNIQLLSLFYGQRHLLSRSRALVDETRSETASQSDQEIPKPGFKRAIYWYKNASYLEKTYVWIGVGSCLIFASTLTTFLVSRRFNPRGLLGHETTQFFCLLGWEWLPSGLYPFIWGWLVGPWILWRIRKIKDSHYWRLSTTMSIVFGLPALPLSLIIGIKPQFYFERPWWTPGLWYVPGLAMMEFVMLFFPLYEVRKVRREQAKLINRQGDPENSKYSMAALERALSDDCEALEEFAVTKDFTGENIIFLKLVRTWKNLWDEFDTRQVSPTKAQLRILFDKAEQIWIKTVCQESADYPINLTDSEYYALSKVFERPKSSGSNGSPGSSSRSAGGISSSTSPYGDSPIPDWEKLPAKSPDVNEKEVFTPPSKSLEASMNDPAWPAQSLRTSLPKNFSKHVFDNAQRSIKLLTLENTWIRFVKSQKTSQTSEGPYRSEGIWKRLWRPSKESSNKEKDNSKTATTAETGGPSRVVPDDMVSPLSLADNPAQFDASGNEAAHVGLGIQHATRSSR